MSLLLFYIFLAVIVSFTCSLLESVILSVTPAYVAVSKREGRHSGRILEKLRLQIDQPLAAILTLNTIANTVGAAGVGSQVHTVYGDEFVAIASAVLTFVILVFSEIIPKTLGATHWKRLAPAVAHLVRALIVLTFPFVILSNKISYFLSAKRDHSVTREEMIETAEIGANEGTILKQESRVIRNLLMLNNISVADIMTPRSVLAALDATSTVEETMAKFKPIRFSRLPIYSGDLDEVVGIIYRYKLMDAASQNLKSLKLEELMDPIHSVPDSIPVAAALDQFIKRKEHLFLVVDEYGSTEGIVTLEDAIETLLGVEIMDEFDSIEDMRAYALEQWRARKTKRKS